MQKGKLKKDKNYLSIVLVPHSQSMAKAVKFSVTYNVCCIIFATFLIIAIGLGLFVSITAHENSKLKLNMTNLSEMNAEQEDLLEEKANELDELQKKVGDNNAKIKEFQDKYREMTENYISSRSSSASTSRSGDRSTRSFIKDIDELKGILDSLSEKGDLGNDVLATLSDTEAKLKKYTESVPTLWPASGKISSGFGGRRDPFQSSRKFHEGIDISAGYGKNVCASASGTVTYSGWYSGYGYTVAIDHGHGISTLYGHNSKLLAKKGQIVKKGDIISKVGSSGRSTGPHLHFEVKINNIPIDPLKYLDK